jgi:hypothetical protein
MGLHSSLSDILGSPAKGDGEEPEDPDSERETPDPDQRGKDKADAVQGMIEAHRRGDGHSLQKHLENFIDMHKAEADETDPTEDEHEDEEREDDSEHGGDEGDGEGLKL